MRKLFIGIILALAAFCSSAGQINVVSQGVVNDCSADQSDAINALIVANPRGTAFYFPSGCYLVAGLGQGGPILTNVDFKGDGPNSTILRAPANSPKNLILSIPPGSSAVSVSGFKFDANGKTGTFFPFYTASSSDIDISNNKFINWYYIATALDGVQGYRVVNNTFIRPVTGGVGQTQTNSIVVSSGTRESSNGIVNNNFHSGAGMNISSANTIVEANLVSSYAYGAGLTTSPYGHGGFFLASGNMLVGGIGKDSDGTFPAGAELNTDYTAFVGNVAAANSGEGVSSSGYATHITANYTAMNGNGSDGLGNGPGMLDIQRSGIVLVSLPGQTGASHSSVLANRSFDGAAGYQKYGYYEMLFNGQLSGVKVIGNHLGGNSVGKVSIGSSATVHDGN